MTLSLQKTMSCNQEPGSRSCAAIIYQDQDPILRSFTWIQILLRSFTWIKILYWDHLPGSRSYWDHLPGSRSCTEIIYLDQDPVLRSFTWIKILLRSTLSWPSPSLRACIFRRASRRPAASILTFVNSSSSSAFVYSDLVSASSVMLNRHPHSTVNYLQKRAIWMTLAGMIVIVMPRIWDWLL